MKKSKRVLSLLLCLVMLLSLFPTAVFAETDNAGIMTGQEDFTEQKNHVRLGLFDETRNPDGAEESANGIEEAIDTKATEESLNNEETVSSDGLIRVSFACDPTDIKITVFDPSAVGSNGDFVVIEPESDGSYFLKEGSYFYDSEYYGAVVYERTRFSITMDLTNGEHIIAVRAPFPENWNTALQGSSSKDTITAASVENFLWPAYGIYGMSRGYFADLNGSHHYGIDIAAPNKTEVHATKSGTVYIEKHGCTHYSSGMSGCGCNGGAGNYVQLIHDDGSGGSRYLHLTNETGISTGTHVNQGGFVGLSGSSGNSTGAHLHFELLSDGKNYKSRYDCNPVNRDGRHYASNASSYTTQSIAYIYVPNENPCSQQQDDYLSKCTYYPSYLGVKAVKDGVPMWTLPCSNSTDSRSTKIDTFSKGTIFEVIGLYLNDQGSYWYKCDRLGTIGYVWCNNVEYCASGEPNITAGISYSGKALPSALTVNEVFYVDWTISSTRVPLFSITGTITDQSSGTRKYTGTETNINAYSKNLKGSQVDNKLSFNKLETGTYSLVIMATVKNYSYNGSYFIEDTIEVPVINCTFTENEATPTVPAKPTASTDYNQYWAGQSVTIKWNSVANASSYYIDVYRDGALLHATNIGNQTSFSLTVEEGTYDYYVYSVNDAGFSDTERRSFSVVQAQITYDANGGTGAPTAQAFIPGGGYYFSTVAPTREGYTFVNWKDDYAGGYYNPGDPIPEAWGSNTMVAQWEVNYYTLDINGVLDNSQIWNTSGVGYAELYINGELAVKGDASYFDYCTALPYGTTYEIRNIRPVDGYSFDGFYAGTNLSFYMANGSRSGTITQDISVALVFHTSPTSLTETSEPVVFNNHTYYYFSTPVTWYDAKTICENMGGHLVTVTSEEENSFIVNLAQGTLVWMGATDVESEGTWEWITGEVFSYSNWHTENPDNYAENPEGAENYLHYSGSGNGQWNDNAGCSLFPFVCEVDSVDYYYLDVNGWIDGEQAGWISGYGTFDLYIDGNPTYINEITETTDIDDYCAAWPYGTTYEIKNIRVNDGYSFDGFLTDSSVSYGGNANKGRVGTITENTSVNLIFHTSPTSLAETPEPVVFNNHTYYYFSTPVTWYDAKTLCENMGGHLVTVTSEEETSFLVDLVGRHSGEEYGCYIWLGATDRDSEGTWKWVTGEEMTYTKWFTDEPDNYPQDAEGAENFAQFYTWQGHWNDYYGCFKMPFVCEVDSASAAVYAGDKINFHAQGGTLGQAIRSRTIDGINAGRANGQLILYKAPMQYSDCNLYGNEIAVDLSGAVIAVRGYGDENQISIPNGGFVLSGHMASPEDSNDGAHFLGDVTIGQYVGIDSGNNQASVYDSYSAYLADNKYVSSGAAYGTLPEPVRDNYIFDGWYTSEQGGTRIVPSSVFSTTELYAHWTAQSYTVSYNANGGASAPADQTKTHAEALTLSSTKPTRGDASVGSYSVTLNPNGGCVSPISLTAVQTETYTFKNWNTAQNGSGTSYNPGTSYTTDAAVTLYAQWDSSISTATVTLPKATSDSCLFLGWSEDSAAENAQYQPGDTLIPTGNVTLYAVWLDLSAPDGKLPGALSELEDEALAGCNFRYVRLPDGMTTLGEKVFDGCDRLLAVYVPASVTSIAPHAFDGAPDGLIIIGLTDSDAERYANENGFSFVAVDLGKCYVNYTSSNGRVLGSEIVSKKPGTTDTMTPPAFDGYSTPEPQTVTWSADSKTVTFVYVPEEVAPTTNSAQWCSSPRMTYTAVIEHQNRTAESVQIRIVWTTTIKVQAFDVYAQKFLGSCGDVEIPLTTVVDYGEWGKQANSDRSKTGTSEWVTIPLNTQDQTSLDISISYCQYNSSGTYASSAPRADVAWTVRIPAY